MGTTSSKVSAEQISNSLLSVVQSSITSSSQRVVSTNIVEIEDCNLINFDSEQNAGIEIQIKSIQDISSNANVKNDMSAKVKQISEAESPNLNLSGGTDSETFTKLVTNLSTSILNSVSANCSNTFQQQNIVTCKNSNADTSTIRQKNLSKVLMSCVQTVSNVTDAKNDLQTFIDQKSKAKTSNAVLYIIIAIIVLIVVCTIVYFLVRK